MIDISKTINFFFESTSILIRGNTSMSTKKKTAKKNKAQKGAKSAKVAKAKGGKGGKGKQPKKNEEIEELRTMIEALKTEMDTMNKTIKKQNKRITALETDNKRMKKNIQKLQMGGGASNGNAALIPRESSTTPLTSDMGTDLESKDNEDLKEEEEIKPKPKPVVVRRNKPKPKRKAEDIKFSFDMNHPNIKSVDNGTSAAKPKTYGGTIRFGRFLHFTKNNNDNLASYVVTFDTRSVGATTGIAFGFATNSFSAWKASNFGENNSCIIKGIFCFLVLYIIITCDVYMYLVCVYI